MENKDRVMSDILHLRSFAKSIEDKINYLMKDKEGFDYCDVSCMDMQIIIRVYYNNKPAKALYLSTDYDFQNYELCGEDNIVITTISKQELISWALDLSATTVQFFIYRALIENVSEVA